MTRVVVVGSGIAGLTAALTASAHGADVTLVTKAGVRESNTRYAQGGIAGVTDPADSVSAHLDDTIRAGAGLTDAAAARVLVEEGPARIGDLVAAGVPFDRAPDGRFAAGLEGAHSFARILHAGGDATGAAIEEALVERLRRSDVTVREWTLLVDVIVEGGRAAGVDLLTGDARARLDADAVVLATGGAGQLYAHSTNPSVATGDGIAAALRAGAAVSDLEFVQFHPTVLAVGEAFLVSEAVRGEGAVLVDEAGHRVMAGVHPEGDLAPRDVVARAIADTMARQDGRPVLLDATGIHSDDPAERAAFLARRFPTIDAALRARGIAWATKLVPVTPAAHYLMGGVATDLDGRTSVRGLYAAGEVAWTGVHGANRLASNSLLEGAVFGARAGAASVAGAADPWRGPTLPPSSASDDPAPAALPALSAPAFDRRALQELMWRDAGVTRTRDGLAHAADTLAAWRAAPRSPHRTAEFEDENLLTVAEHVVAAAAARTRSVGAHHRSDTETGAVLSTALNEWEGAA